MTILDSGSVERTEGQPSEECWWEERRFISVDDAAMRILPGRPPDQHRPPTAQATRSRRFGTALLLAVAMVC